MTRAKPEVSIEVAADEIKEWQPVVFTVSRDESAHEALDVIVVVSESGDMVSAADEGSKTVTIAADMTSQTHEAPTVKDPDWEEHSTVTAEITANDAYTIASGAATASKQVIDNDFPRATAVLRAAPNPVAEGGTLTATVWITTKEDQIPHEDGGAIVVSTTAGTASAADFTALTTAAGTLEFEAGDFAREDIGGADMRWVARQDATVAITDDGDQEDVERFTVSMARVTSGSSATESAITFGVNSDSVEVRISSSDQPTVSTDASLGGLTLSAGRLTPMFASATTSYGASVPYPVSELTVTAATGHAKANIDYLDSSDNVLADADDSAPGQQVGLAVGGNVIKIKVTAEDATTTTTYTLTITRAAASTDANLSNLTLSAGTLSPGFAALTATYTVSVGYDVTRITVTPVKSDDNATLDYLDSSDNVLADADDSAPGQQVNLAVGGNVIQIEVTAEDEATSRTYTVTVTRANANAAPSFSSSATFDEAENQTAAGTVLATDSDADDDVTGYKITGGADQAFFSIGATSGALTFDAAPNYEDAQDQGSNNTYVVEVTATSGTGAREKTATQTITVTVTDVNTEAPGQPAAPNVAAASVTSLTVNWSAPSNAGPAISDYDVQYRAGMSGDWSDAGHAGTATTATLTGLSENTSYEVQVRAKNDEGTGAWSDSGSGTTDANAAPSFSSPATFNSAENQTSVGTVRATDTDSDDDITGFAITGGADQTLFRINGTSGVLSITPAPNYEDAQDQDTNNTYLVEVTATSGTGTREKTATQTITVTVTDVNTEAPGKPAAPNVSSASATSLSVNWSAPTNAGPAISDYDVQYRAGTSGGWSDGGHNGTATTATITGLAENTSYQVQVRAKNDEGTGAWSDSGPTSGPGPGPTGGGGGPSGPSPSTRDFEWTVKHDIEALDAANAAATGVWSDGETLWVVDNPDGAGDGVYAYDLETGERVEEREFELDDANRAPRGVWSDGTVIWVSDSGRDKLFAHDLASGERLPDSDLALHPDNDDPRGIWSDGETMWVLDGGDDALFAYDLESGEVLAVYELDPVNGDPRDLFFDGVTFWVSDHGAKRLFAYRLEAGEEGELERNRDEEFTELSKASNNSPRGIWSDGDVIYVADQSDDKVYSYNMPDAIDARLASLTLSGVGIGEFSPGREEYAAVVAEGVTETTVEAEAMQRRTTVVIDPPDADEEAEGHQVAIEGVEAITVTVTSADDSRRKTYRVRFPETGWDPARDPWPHCLRGAVSEGFSLVVFAGGSVDELSACAESRDIVALYALHEGVYVSYLLVAPDFVNRKFRELFPDGLPVMAPLVAGSNGPPSADPFGGDLEAAGQPWPQCLRGEIAPGFSLVVFEGGSIEQLVSCAESRHVTALYIQHNGEWVSYILGAPDFANVSFVELYADGLPAVTPLVVKSEGAPAN